jgi:regulator of replication initiation timing
VEKKKIAALKENVKKINHSITMVRDERECLI